MLAFAARELGKRALFRRGAASLRDADVQLVWPPPASAGLDVRLDESTAVEREAGSRDGNAAEPPASAAAASHQEARREAITGLLRERGVTASSARLAKTTLLKLPVKQLREELEAWGMNAAPLKKPELAARLADLLQEAAPRHVPERAPQLPVEKVAQWVADTHLSRILILDVRGICAFADAMVLATARSQRHVFAAASGVAWQVAQETGRTPHMEGSEGSDWLAVDCGSTVVHVFTEAARQLYDLEELWGRPDCVSAFERAR